MSVDRSPRNTTLAESERPSRQLSELGTSERLRGELIVTRPVDSSQYVTFDTATSSVLFKSHNYVMTSSDRICLETFINIETKIENDMRNKEAPYHTRRKRRHDIRQCDGGN